MICEICGENEATFHYSEVINGVKTEHHLCAECASKTDISYYSNFFDNDRIGQFLSGLLGNAPVFGSHQDAKSQIMCPNCKTSYGEFVKNSAFGCAECYNVFEPLLADSIKKIQGSTLHQGKTPRKMQSDNLSDTTENFAGDVINEIDKNTDNTSDCITKASSSENRRKELNRQINTLSERLKAAVAEEDFSQAAKLRDKIKELKSEMEGGAANA